MCKKGLFYFHRPLDDGPPKDTCLVTFYEKLASDAKPFAVVSIITGVLCLFLFIIHFGLYWRPLPDKININTNQEHQNIEQFNSQS